MAAPAAIFVVSVHGWMNATIGFRLEGGKALDIGRIVAMFNPAWVPEAIHMTFAAYAATAFAVAGVHAFLLTETQRVSPGRPDSFQMAANGDTSHIRSCIPGCRKIISGGGAEFTHKPIDPLALVATVQRLLIPSSTS